MSGEVGGKRDAVQQRGGELESEAVRPRDRQVRRAALRGHRQRPIAVELAQSDGPHTLRRLHIMPHHSNHGRQTVAVLATIKYSFSRQL